MIGASFGDRWVHVKEVPLREKGNWIHSRGPRRESYGLCVELCREEWTKKG